MSRKHEPSEAAPVPRRGQPPLMLSARRVRSAFLALSVAAAETYSLPGEYGFRTRAARALGVEVRSIDRMLTEGATRAEALALLALLSMEYQESVPKGLTLEEAIHALARVEAK